MTKDGSQNYLAVLKASYDYEPQSEDEIAITEDELLLLVERVDDEWWKVKVKAGSQDTDSPVGLVPAAYVEQAGHSSVVKAIYDYEANAPGELSLHEDDVLFVFDTEEDWILVQNTKEEGKAGYVPGNYVESVDEEEPSLRSASSRIIVPDSPPRPATSYVDPADRVASTKVTADDIQTWSLSEIDKKGKKKKGTLGIGNGAVFFASEADKTPVQKWQTKDVLSVSAEKSKHVHVDIGGPIPISLHFHTNSKENAEEIVAKLNVSKAISFSSSSESNHEQHSSRNPPSSDTPPRESKKASVHFSPASPVIIPPSQEEEEGDAQETEEQVITPIAGASEVVLALYDFVADGEDELSVTEGESLTILEKDGDEWWKCRNEKGKEGVVPASYLETVNETPGNYTPEIIVDRGLEDRKAQELAKQREIDRVHEEAEREKAAAAARKSEAQQKAKQAAVAAEVERQKRKEASAVTRVSSPPVGSRSQEPSIPIIPAASTRTSSELGRPPADKTRVWHDRSGQFRVEAAFLGFNNGKLRLHKVNGVIVEVPSEKMSLEDMRYVEKTLDKKQRSSSSPRVSDDDIPLALSKVATSNSQKTITTPKRTPKIDWFDFFLSAGCDLDDCTRYAASFERDKIDETLLGDITEGTMRSLGLREGDIIRTKKAIEKRKPTDNLHKTSGLVEEQMRRDEELARQLQSQEASSARGPAPNLFAGPGGVLKPRRGRPQPSKSLPLSNVDIKAISSASDQIQRTNSPQTQSPVPFQTPSLPIRPSSAAPVSGFDDDAWTNRPSSTKPVKSVSPITPLISSAPSPPAQSAPTLTVASQTTSTPPQLPTVPLSQGTPNLAKTSESDIYEQLARLSALRQNPTPAQPQNLPPTPPTVPSVPVSYHGGLGMSPSPIPFGQQLNNRPTLSPPSGQAYNGPRGPFAPVPANQSLLQPLIPTQTGFNGFIPTKPGNSPSPFQTQLAPPSFLSQSLTGFPNTQPVMTQPTGLFFNPAPPFQGNNGFSPIQNHITGFNPPVNQSGFGNIGGPSSPPSLPSNQHQSNNISPANVFAQMKSGTFANDNDNPPNSGLNAQSPGWGQSYQGYTGY